MADSNITVGGGSAECLSSEKRPKNYDAWVSTFRLYGGSEVELFSGPEDPGFIVGRRYRLPVNPVLLEE